MPSSGFFPSCIKSDKFQQIFPLHKVTPNESSAFNGIKSVVIDYGSCRNKLFQLCQTFVQYINCFRLKKSSLTFLWT